MRPKNQFNNQVRPFSDLRAKNTINQDLQQPRMIFKRMYSAERFDSFMTMDAMREKINYKGSVNSMYGILKNLGFRYRKCNDGRKFIMKRGGGYRCCSRKIFEKDAQS